jgi:hypothetical protein
MVAVQHAEAPGDVRPAPALPKASMLQFVNSYRLGQLLSVAARLGVADVLRDGPKPVTTIANATSSVASCLHRVLRALASVGVFEETESGVFGLTPLASTLRSDAPMSLRGAAAMIGEDWHWRTWSALGHSVRTGEPAFDAIFGTSFDEAYDTLAGLRPSFDAATENLEKLAALSLLASYSFADVHLVVDIESAGGFGGLLFAILAQNPSARGVLCDRASIVARAQDAAKNCSVEARCAFHPWSYGEALPGGGDLYLLRNVLRDHDDARAVRVLTACRDAMAPGGRIAIVEMLVANGNDLSLGKVIDIDALLFSPSGRERTEREYRVLADAAGLNVERVIATPGPLSVVQCTVRVDANGGAR